MILNVGTKATQVFLTTLAVSCVLACSKNKNSELANPQATPPQPNTENLQQLTVRVMSASPLLKSVLLQTNTPSRHQGLSSAFHIDTTQQIQQLIGILSSSEMKTFSATAITRSDEQVECTGFPQSPVSIEQPTRVLSYSCRNMKITLLVAHRPVAANQFAIEQTLRALKAQATLTMHDKFGSIQLTLLKESVFIDSEKDSTRYLINAHERETLLSGQGKIRLRKETSHCARSNCVEALETKTLQLKASGELSLEFVSSSDNVIKTLTYHPLHSLRVASYNVENFWDDDPNNSMAYNDYSAQFSNWQSGQFAEKKARRIRTALIAAGLPEIIGLQEIESASNQSRSLELLKPLLSELGYNHYALGQQAADNPTAVTTAVISKFPLVENLRVDFLFKPEQLNESEQRDFIGASRDPQRVSVVLPGGVVLTLLNSHWKSKRDKSPWGDIMRRTLAEIIRTHVESIDRPDGKPAPIIVVGDFNADYREEPVYAGLQLAQSLAKARSTQQSNKLVPLWLTLPAQEQGNYPHDAHFQALDNIIITRSLLQGGPIKLAAALQVVGQRGISAHTLSNGDGLPMRSQLRKYKDSAGEMRTTHFDQGFSDHLPIVAHFHVSPKDSSTNEEFLFAETIENQNLLTLPQVEIKGNPCGEAMEITSSTSLSHVEVGECIVFAQREFVMHKTGLHNIYIELNGDGGDSQHPEKIVITSDRAFGANKNWLRRTLQSSAAGQRLKFIRGRIGYLEGYKAIFIHAPETDIVFE